MSKSPIRVRLVADATAYIAGMKRARLMTLVSFWLARRRARDQWLSRRMLPATPSPWAAPTRGESAR